MWNENFQFDVYVPQLAMVRFLVEDYDSTSDNEFVGQYSLPFNSLKMGKFSSWRRIFAEFMAFISPLTATQWWFIVFTLHKGTIPPLVEHREVNSNSAQRALRILLLSDHWLQPLCAPTGYRHVPLLNKNGDVLPSAGLFVHIMVLDAEWDVNGWHELLQDLHYTAMF